MAAADLRMHVGRRAADAREAPSSLPNGPQVEVAKALSRRFGGHDRAHARRRLAQHDGDQPAPAPLRADDRVEPSGTDEPCLHAVGARIAPEQPVVSVEHMTAERDRADPEILAMIGEFGEQARGRGWRDPARRNDGRDSASRSGSRNSCPPCPSRWAERFIIPAKPSTEPPMLFRKRDRDVVRRFDEQHLECVVDGQHRARDESPSSRAPGSPRSRSPR